MTLKGNCGLLDIIIFPLFGVIVSKCNLQDVCVNVVAASYQEERRRCRSCRWQFGLGNDDGNEQTQKQYNRNCSRDYTANMMTPPTYLTTRGVKVVRENIYLERMCNESTVLYNQQRAKLVSRFPTRSKGGESFIMYS